MYTHALSRNLKCITMNSQAYFHRRLFADPVKPGWCITGPTGQLGNTNQNWLGAKLLSMAVLIHLVVCVHSCCVLGAQHHCLLPNGREGPPSACPPTYTTARPLPPTHPLISAICDITGVVKNYFHNQQWILHSRVSYEILATSLLYLYRKGCVTVM